MLIIEANKEFNSADMHLELMIYGVYCYHDTILENIIPENIEWKHTVNRVGPYAVTDCPSASKILKDTQLHKYREYFPDLEFINSSTYYNVDNGVNIWHTDKRENIKIQAICYQTNFYTEDGGSLQIKCYDGIERHYYPKNGDVILMNHATDLVHRIDTILTDKKRIAINMVMQ
jgi:hypothetical protein